MVTKHSTVAAALDLRIVAIVAAFNEADVIAQVVGDLIEQGIEVYLLDHGSNDGTVDAVRAFLGRGLIAIEAFPEESGVSAEDAEARPWESILARKQQLASELDGDWFIHHDADELRESLWPEISLAEAIRRVDQAGYNAIDFEVLDFPPVDDRFRAGDDLRQAFPYFERSPVWNKVQIRCWKKTSGPLDLVSSGGHEAVFPGREVFPFRFPVRHYPIRSQAHGERKVIAERRPRLVTAERERGWHRQYDDISDGHGFVRDPADLTPYDPDLVRLELLLGNRCCEALDGDSEMRRLADESLLRERDLLGAELDRRNRKLARLQNELDDRSQEVERAGREIADLRAEAESLDRQLAQIRASMSWRLTAPLRAALKMLRGF